MGVFDTIVAAINPFDGTSIPDLMQDSNSGIVQAAGNVLEDGVLGAAGTALMNTDSGFLQTIGGAMNSVDNFVDDVINPFDGSNPVAAGVSNVLTTVANTVTNVVGGGNNNNNNNNGSCPMPPPLDKEGQCKANDAAIALTIKQLMQQQIEQVKVVDKLFNQKMAEHTKKYQDQINMLASKMCCKPKMTLPKPLPISCRRPTPSYKMSTCGCN